MAQDPPVTPGSTTASAPPSRATRNMRRALLSLLATLSLAGSGYWLYVSWPAWAVAQSFRTNLEMITVTAASPDGTLIAFGGRDGIVRLVDMASKSEKYALQGHSKPVNLAEFSPDLKWLLTADMSGEARLWDLATGKETAHLKGHTRPLERAAFSADSTRVATASQDSTVHVWTLATPAAPLVLKGHHDTVNVAVFSPDGKQLMTGGVDATVRFWNAETGKREGAISGHKDAIHDVAYSPDGKLIATASADTTAQIWNLEMQQERGVLRWHTFAIWSVKFSPDGTRLLTAAGDGTVRLWDVETAAQIAELKGHQSMASAVFSPDGQRMATASNNGRVRVWSALTGQLLDDLQGPAGTLPIAFTTDGKGLVQLGQDGSVRVWQRRRAENFSGVTALPALWAFVAALALLLWRLFKRKPYVRGAHRAKARRIEQGWWRRLLAWTWAALRYSLRTAFIAMLLIGSTVTLHRNWRPYALERKIGVPAAGVTHVWFLDDGAAVCTWQGASTVGTRLSTTIPGEGRLTVWSTLTGAKIREAELPNMEAVQVAADGHSVLFKNFGGSVHQVWDAAQLVKVSHIPTGSDDEVVLSPDRRLLAVVDNTRVYLWDAATGRQLRSFLHQLRSASSIELKFSPDARHCVVYGRYNTAFVHDTETGEIKSTLKGHVFYIQDAAFSSDARHVATAGEDNTVRLWDAATGEQLAVLKGHDKSVEHVAFVGNDTRIMSSANDLRVWDTTTHLETARLPASGFFAGVAGDRAAIMAGSNVTVADLQSGNILDTLGQSGIWHRPAISRDGTRVAAIGLDGLVNVWKKQRNDAAGGQIYLPELWLTVILGIALLWSLIRDWRDNRKRKALREAQTPPPTLKESPAVAPPLPAPGIAPSPPS